MSDKLGFITPSEITGGIVHGNIPVLTTGSMIMDQADLVKMGILILDGDVGPVRAQREGKTPFMVSRLVNGSIVIHTKYFDPNYDDSAAEEPDYVETAPWIPETDPIKISILAKLAEEANELSKACTRAIMQGFDGIDPTTGMTHHDSIINEYADVEALIRVGCVELDFYVTSSDFYDRIEKKHTRFTKWLVGIRAFFAKKKALDELESDLYHEATESYDDPDWERE